MRLLLLLGLHLTPRHLPLVLHLAICSVLIGIWLRCVRCMLSLLLLLRLHLAHLRLLLGIWTHCMCYLRLLLPRRLPLELHLAIRRL